MPYEANRAECFDTREVSFNALRNRARAVGAINRDFFSTYSRASEDPRPDETAARERGVCRDVQPSSCNSGPPAIPSTRRIKVRAKAGEIIATWSGAKLISPY